MSGQPRFGQVSSDSGLRSLLPNPNPNFCGLGGDAEGQTGADEGNPSRWRIGKSLTHFDTALLRLQIVLRLFRSDRYANDVAYAN